MEMLWTKMVEGYLRSDYYQLMERSLRFFLSLNSTYRTFRVTLKWTPWAIPSWRDAQMESYMIDREKESTREATTVMSRAI